MQGIERSTKLFATYKSAREFIDMMIGNSCAADSFLVQELYSADDDMFYHDGDIFEIIRCFSERKWKVMTDKKPKKK